MANDKEDFLEKYKDCASYQVLNKIWNGKKAKATSLNLTGKGIYNLSPLASLVSLQSLNLTSTSINKLDIDVLKHLKQLKTLIIALQDLNPLLLLMKYPILVSWIILV